MGVHASSNSIDLEYVDLDRRWELSFGTQANTAPWDYTLGVRGGLLGNPGLECQSFARLGTRIREVDLPLSADIQGECGNPSSGESTTGIWLKLHR